MESIVLIFPHPDDDAYGMGGTSLLMKGRFKFYSFCLTKGERGLSLDPSEETAAIREKEEMKACSLIGSELEFFGCIDGELFASREICEKIALRLKEIQPRAVLTTWHIENHPDHASASEIAVKACKLADIYDKVEIYHTEEGAGSQTMGFEPVINVDISNVIEEKKELIRCHVCQNKDDKMCEGAIKQSAFRGQLAGCEYAEVWRSYFPFINGKIPVLLELFRLKGSQEFK